MIFDNKYVSKKLIGKGTFGIIFKVLNKENNKLYALKFIMNENNNKSNIFLEQYK